LVTVIAIRPLALILDLSDVSFCSAQGLSVLLATSNDGQAAGIPCAIVTDQPAVLRPISLLCMDRVLQVHRTLNDAFDWLAVLPRAGGTAHQLPHVV
jgi:anti-anti-sigma factor